MLFCERVRAGGGGEKREFVALAVTFTTRRPKVILPSIRPGPAAPPFAPAFKERIRQKGEKKGRKFVSKGTPLASTIYIYSSNGFQILRAGEKEKRERENIK